jgi:hypothetical protein
MFMNPELDLDDLELATEPEETLVETPEITLEKINPIEKGREFVTSTIVRNIFDVDLEKSLLAVVSQHFDALSTRPIYGADIFQIPDLNMKIWKAFHDYEDFIHENKFENIDLNEIAKIIREQVTPAITEELREITVLESQQS